MLEAAGYIVSSHTKKDWVVFTPKGNKIVFKQDTGVTKGMPYIDLCTNKAGLAMIEMIRNNFESYAKKDIEKAKLSRAVQSMVRHPSQEQYVQIVSQKDLKTCLVCVEDVKNAKVMFGPYRPRFKRVEHTEKLQNVLAVKGCISLGSTTS